MKEDPNLGKVMVVSSSYVFFFSTDGDDECVSSLANVHFSDAWP